MYPPPPRKGSRLWQARLQTQPSDKQPYGWRTSAPPTARGSPSSFSKQTRLYDKGYFPTPSRSRFKPHSGGKNTRAVKDLQ